MQAGALALHRRMEDLVWVWGGGRVHFNRLWRRVSRVIRLIIMRRDCGRVLKLSRQTPLPSLNTNLARTPCHKLTPVAYQIIQQGPITEFKFMENNWESKNLRAGCTRRRSKRIVLLCRWGKATSTTWRTQVIGLLRLLARQSSLRIENLRCVVAWTIRGWPLTTSPRKNLRS